MIIMVRLLYDYDDDEFLYDHDDDYLLYDHDDDVLLYRCYYVKNLYKGV